MLLKYIFSDVVPSLLRKNILLASEFSLSGSSVVLQTLVIVALHLHEVKQDGCCAAGFLTCFSIPRGLLDALRMEFPVLSADFTVSLDVLMEQQMLKATFHGL